MPRRLLPLATFVLLAGLGPVAAADLTLVDFAEPNVLPRLQPNSGGDAAFAIVDTAAGKALEVTCTPGQNSYPGVQMQAPAGGWNLSAYGQAQATITNLSDAALTVTLRVDNGGDWRQNPWNAEHASIPARGSGTINVYFGYSWGNPGFRLDPAKVVSLLLFTGKATKETRWRIDALRATGQPGAKPPGLITTVRPPDGVLLDPATFAAGQVEAKGAQVTVEGEGANRRARLSAVPAPRQPAPVATVKCPPGVIWDLSPFTQVDFTLHNPGAEPVRAFCRVDNRGATATTNSALAEATLTGGETRVVTVPFAAARPWVGGDKTAGSQLASDAVTAVTVALPPPTAPVTIEVRAVRAVAAPPPALPDWLGQRPPVPGTWTRTFTEEFDEPTLNLTRSTLPPKPEASFWDKVSANVPENASVADGLLRLRCEQRPGGWPDPALQGRTYQTTVVTTFDKFRQRYGYFEARLKLPTTLGLWPAFWMMPDRGPDAGIWWMRQDTKNGGMETDIMEHLVRFGPYRYNIAAHWDGYQKEHQSIGTDRIYVQPDAAGFLTAGLLWEPGKLSFYANGQLVGAWQNERVGSVPGYLMFTLPTGGWGTRGYIDNARLPDVFCVDWVRVWQNDAWK